MRSTSSKPATGPRDAAILHEGVWLPPGERHLVEMMSPGAKRFARLPDGRASYQRHKYLAALACVPLGRRRVFVDVGAHVGLWSMQAETDFDMIFAFEPHPVHADLFGRNVRKGSAVVLAQVALGDREGTVGIASRPGSSGDSHVTPDGMIPMRTLDSFPLRRVDLLKIDTEGYELPICIGARETLMRTKPVVVVEQKGKERDHFDGEHEAARRYLEGLGMKPLLPPISGDWIMGWPG